MLIWFLYLDEGGVMPLKIEKQKVFLMAVYEAEGQPPLNALEHFVREGQSDKAKFLLTLAPDLKISEAFPKDRASRFILARFIAQGQFTETQKQNFSERLFEKTDGKEGQPPLNALELLVLEGKHDHAKAVLLLAPGLKISEAFPKDRALRLSLARFIAQGEFTETQKQNFSERLFEKTDRTEGQPPLNALELLVLEGEYDHAKAVLLLAPDLKISEAFPKDGYHWVVFGSLFWMNIRV